MYKKSSIEKGKRFEKYLLERVKKELDMNAFRISGSGNGLDKNDIRIPSMNIELEAKNAATFNVQGDWEQAKRQKTTGNMSILVIRHPKRPEFEESVVVMDLEDFFVLAQNQAVSREIIATPDPKNKWIIQNMIDSAKKVLKIYDND